MANSMNFNSTDLSGSSYALTVLQQHIGAYSTVNVDVAAIPFAPGVAQYSGMNPKVFTVECLIDGTSTSHLTTCLDNLSVLFHATEDKPLSFDDWYSDRFWLARYTGGLEAVSLLGKHKANVTLSFVAPDPVAYSNTYIDSLDYTITTSPQSFIVKGTGSAVEGNTYSYPMWILAPDDTSYDFTIKNETTGESLTWANILSSPWWLIIQSQYYLVASSPDGGETLYPSMQTVSGTFPRLMGGVENTITMTNFSGHVIPNYYGRYL